VLREFHTADRGRERALTGKNTVANHVEAGRNGPWEKVAVIVQTSTARTRTDVLRAKTHDRISKVDGIKYIKRQERPRAALILGQHSSI